MTPTRQGSFRLFRFAGIEVFVHWSWFVIAWYQIDRMQHGSSFAWSALEYLALFLIVLMHEFGHSLACRSVGGHADQIILWPLGGVAYVDPPQRPGAVLWSIAAGPVVNVVLAPILIGAWLLASKVGWEENLPGAYTFIRDVTFVNLALLFFNVLPIYPLDGGQILRALLWFPLGRWRSLLIATGIGFAGVAALIGLAIWQQSLWTGVICVFIFLNCGRGLREGLALMRMAKAPRRAGFACPACKAAPPIGAFWTCGNCRKPFDTFESFAQCPNCGTQFGATRCFECGAMSPIPAWASGAVPPPMAWK